MLALLCAGLVVLAVNSHVLAQPQKPVMMLRIFPDNYGTEVKAGETKSFSLEIKNMGDKPLTDVRLSAEKPEGWNVEFKPASIATVNSGNFQTVDISIVPSPKADRGSYNVVLVARANEAQESYHLWLRIEESSGLWLWIGGGITIIIIAVFIFIFMRSNRQ